MTALFSALPLNSQTSSFWAGFLCERLERGGEDRIRSLVDPYFDFAHPNLWSAIYDHRLSAGEELDQSDHEQHAKLTST